LADLRCLGNLNDERPGNGAGLRTQAEYSKEDEQEETATRDELFFTKMDGNCGLEMRSFDHAANPPYKLAWK
jgi:hypothetical protein